MSGDHLLTPVAQDIDSDLRVLSLAQPEVHDVGGLGLVRVGCLEPARLNKGFTVLRQGWNIHARIVVE